MLAYFAKMRVLFVIRSLELGGAERRVLRMASGLAARGHQVAVAVFYLRGSLLAEAERRGIPVIDLRKAGPAGVIGLLRRLAGAIDEFAPDAVHSLMPAANIACALARIRRHQSARLVWGVASSDMQAHARWGARIVFSLEGLLSRVPDAIVANSRSGRDVCISRGFPAERMRIVMNGIDTHEFSPDSSDAALTRSNWGIPVGTVVVGTVGRIDPVKGTDVFLAAAALLARDCPELHFVCIGPGDPEYAAAMSQLAAKLGIGARVSFPGAICDAAAAYNALDVCVLASWSEGLPNCLIEALACGVACVSTDVGDARLLLEGVGELVPPGDPAALAGAIRRAIDDRLPARLIERRRRAVERFDADASAAAIEAVLAERDARVT